MTVDIRDFRSEDHALALALWQATEGVGLSDADSFENVQRFLARNPALSLVAVAGDALVGTILCGHDGRRGLIHHLAVASSHRRKGLGRELVQRALRGLERQGIKKCHLLVFQHNAAGKAFWDRLGAEERTTIALFSLSTES